MDEGRMRKLLDRQVWGPPHYLAGEIISSRMQTMAGQDPKDRPAIIVAVHAATATCGELLDLALLTSREFRGGHTLAEYRRVQFSSWKESGLAAPSYFQFDRLTRRLVSELSMPRHISWVVPEGGHQVLKHYAVTQTKALRVLLVEQMSNHRKAHS